MMPSPTWRFSGRCAMVSHKMEALTLRGIVSSPTVQRSILITLPRCWGSLATTAS